MTVIGRENEYKLLKLKIQKFIKDETNTTIYISGVPGSGKTYTLTNIFIDLSIDFIYINAGHLKLKNSIYRTIFEKISCEKTKTQSYISSLHNHFEKCAGSHIIVIDEIDLLINKTQNILYNLFDLAYLDQSKVLLILISNTMNLPEQTFESKICSRIGKNRVDFKPYTHTQIKKILKASENFKENDTNNELISRRVASVCGDMRKALNLVDKVSNDTVISNIFSEMFEPLSLKFLPNLSRYQKLLLFVVCNTTDHKVESIYKTFKTHCNAWNIRNLDFYEFISVLNKLKSYGIISYRNFKDKIGFNLFVEDVEKSLKNDKYFNSFYND
ncbi:hypothetical protein P3W45_001092 [Vairimorpha bombi]|jgi:origin recognition complex subunit 1